LFSSAWVDIVATDPSLLLGEWAGVRPSWAAERKIVGAGRKAACNTFVFRACGYALRLVIAQDDAKKPGFFDRMSMGRKITEIAKGGTGPTPRSQAIFTIAFAAAPEKLDELIRTGERRRCDHCQCVFISIDEPPKSERKTA
jgi:hypothetical protein